MKRLKLAGLAVLGLSAVSIPVTIALVLSATGGSDLLTLGPTRSATPIATASATPAADRCRARHGYYALTFEDGPLPATTRRLVAALRDAGATATFFDIGERAAAHPELVGLQSGVGVVGSHGYTHVRLTSVSPERRIQELQATARVLGYPSALVRPPFGATDAKVDADLRVSGLTPVYWTVDMHDGVRTAGALVAASPAVTSGDILLLHEGTESAIAAVGPLVRALRRRGLCSGRLTVTPQTVLSPEGQPFHVVAAKP